jgi:hypothetical protein
VYVATCCGNLTVDTCAPGRTYDTAVEVFRGGCGGLVSIGCNDDAGGACGLGSSLTVSVVTGSTYHIRLGGFNGSAGSATLTLGCVAAAPANDECAGAIPVNLGTNGPFTNNCATNSVAPAWTCGSSLNSKDVWFSFVANCTAPHTLLTCGANFDTVVQVFDACGGAVVGCNDDAGALGPCAFTLQSRLQVNLLNGLTYFIRVGSFSTGGSGNFPLDILAGSGNGSITLSNAGGCGGTTISVTGNPNLLGTVTSTLSNIPASSGVFIGYDFGPWTGGQPCPAPCVIGHNWGYPFFSTSQALSIPCVSAFIGTILYTQGATLGGASSGCPFIPIDLTDTYAITIG